MEDVTGDTTDVTESTRNVTESTPDETESTPGLLSGPLMCGLDKNGDILVFDHLNQRLQVCSNSGKWALKYSI